MKQELIYEWQEESSLSWEDFLVSQVKEAREIIYKMFRSVNVEIVTLREHNMKAQNRIEKLADEVCKLKGDLEFAELT
jgi:hypothetical protein